MTGHDAISAYWIEDAGEHVGVVFTHQVISEEPAVALWQTSFRRSNGDAARLDGIFLLEFDQGGLCTKLREWWHLE